MGPTLMLIRPSQRQLPRRMVESGVLMLRQDTESPLRALCAQCSPRRLWFSWSSSWRRRILTLRLLSPMSERASAIPLCLVCREHRLLVDFRRVGLYFSKSLFDYRDLAVLIVPSSDSDRVGQHRG